ncbi:MAG: hypothetical protein ACTSXV_00285 [Alphaproteobacteria bacterium]
MTETITAKKVKKYVEINDPSSDKPQKHSSGIANEKPAHASKAIVAHLAMKKAKNEIAKISTHQQQKTTAVYEQKGRKIFVSPFRNAVWKPKETDLAKLKIAETTNEKN